MQKMHAYKIMILYRKFSHSETIGFHLKYLVDALATKNHYTYEISLNSFLLIVFNKINKTFINNF